MNDLIAVVVSFLGVMGLVFFCAVLSGTIVWLIWGSVIPYLFPALVVAGYIAPDITWFQAVGLTWLCGILLKSTNTNNSKSD